jgi:hypothetical protein
MLSDGPSALKKRSADGQIFLANTPPDLPSPEHVCE